MRVDLRRGAAPAMPPEVIGRRMARAAQSGREQGARAGQAVARGVIDLGAGLLILLALVPVLAVFTLLLLILLYLALGLLAGLVCAVAPSWPVLAALLSACLIALAARRAILEITRARHGGVDPPAGRDGG